MNQLKLVVNLQVVFMYADDIVILSKSAEGLQKSLDSLGIYFDKWCLNVNTKKSKFVVFNSRPGRYSFHIKQSCLQEADKINYLGFIFTASGMWDLFFH